MLSAIGEGGPFNILSTQLMAYAGTHSREVHTAAEWSPNENPYRSFFKWDYRCRVWLSAEDLTLQKSFVLFSFSVRKLRTATVKATASLISGGM